MSIVFPTLDWNAGRVRVVRKEKKIECMFNVLMVVVALAYGTIIGLLIIYIQFSLWVSVAVFLFLLEYSTQYFLLDYFL